MIDVPPRTPVPDDRPYPVTRAALILEIGEGAVRNRIAAGAIVAATVGPHGGRAIRRADLLAYIDTLGDTARRRARWRLDRDDRWRPHIRRFPAIGKEAKS